MPNTLRQLWQSNIATWRGIGASSAAPTTGDATCAAAVRIYQDFARSGLDYSGQLSSAYNTSALSADITVSPPVGDLVLPGLGALTVTLSGNISRGKETLVVLERIPRQCAAPSALAGETTGPSWSTTRPVALNTLQGTCWSAALGVTVQAGLEPPVDTDELGITLDLGVSASVGVDGQYVQLRDVMPLWFVSPQESALADMAGLENALERILGPSKREAKAEIDAWISARIDALLQSRSDGSALPEIPPSVSDKVKDLVLNKAIGELESAISKVLSPLKMTLKLPGISSLLKAWNNPKTSDLRVKLRALRVEVNKAVYADPKVKAADLEQIDTYNHLLDRYQQLATAEDSSYAGRLCFLRLLSLKGKFHVGATAEASGPDVPLGEVQGVSFGVNAPTVTVDANAQGEVQRIGYRFQSWGQGTGDAPLVLTRDTVITYRRLSADARVVVQAAIALNDLEKELQASVGGSAAYLSMTYQSFVTRWLYPSGSATRCAPREGSGVAFGVSTRTQRLIDACAKTGASSYLDGLARQLRVPTALLRTLVQTADIGDPGAASLEPGLTTVFLESSFALPSELRLGLSLNSAEGKAPVYNLDDPMSDPNVKALVKGLPTLAAGKVAPAALRALRVRVRMSDQLTADPKPLVRLGFEFGGTGLSIDVSKISGAGHEGFFDYCALWYQGGDPVADADAKALQERSVPPVVLLHQ